jgi:hypothetical protein
MNSEKKNIKRGRFPRKKINQEPSTCGKVSRSFSAKEIKRIQKAQPETKERLHQYNLKVQQVAEFFKGEEEQNLQIKKRHLEKNIQGRKEYSKYGSKLKFYDEDD